MRGVIPESNGIGCEFPRTDSPGDLQPGSGISEPFEVVLVKPKFMPDLVKQRNHDFFVDDVVGFGLLEAAREFDDAFAEEMDVRRKFARAVHRLLCVGNARMQPAERGRLFFVVGVDPEVAEHFRCRAIQRDDRHLVDELAKCGRQLLDRLFQKRVEAVTVA